VISAMPTYFAGTRVEACGLLEVEADPAAVSATTACTDEAIAARRPVIFARAVQGTDSGVAVANLTRREGATYAGYAAHFDSDPCGGDCGDTAGRASCAAPARRASRPRAPIAAGRVLP
jgi:hypothetical protein